MRMVEADALAILRASSLSGLALTLPPVQLNRDIYKRVATIIEHAGGKWSKKDKAHIFTSDPSDLRLTIASGRSESRLQKLQAFFTPSFLARKLATMANVSGKVVMEPSAGLGSIADACIECGAHQVDCVEVDRDHINALRERHPGALRADFLLLPASPKYDRIVMNPPFSKNQDVKHVEHACKFLKPGGILVAVMAHNVNRAFFNRPGLTLEALPRKTFHESGTDVNTMIVTLADCPRHGSTEGRAKVFE